MIPAILISWAFFAIPNAGDLFVFLIVVLPYLLPWAAIAGVVLLLIRISRKKKAKKQAQNETPEEK